MEDVLKYENRDQLYEPLLKDLNLRKVAEKYDEKVFGNFYIDLAAKEFLIRYVNDRHFLTIEFVSNYAPTNIHGLTDWRPLSFLMNLVNNAPELNPGNKQDNASRITELNEFLKMKYDLINDLLNKNNYKLTMNKLDTRLEQEFKSRHPDWSKNW